MANKKLLTIILGSVALLSLAGGAFLLFNPFAGNSNEPEPTATNEPTAELARQAAVDALKETDEYQTAVDTYSIYFNLNESDLGVEYDPDLIIPSLNAVGSYTEEAFFNKYFVSGYWEAKDQRSPNAINKYLSPYITEKYSEELVALSSDPAVPLWDSMRDKLYVPDPSMSVLPACAEDWEELSCFTLPPTIQKITAKGVSANTAEYTVSFQMDVIFQSPNNQDGVYTRQQRNYVVTYSVDNTNPSYKNLQMTDIKVNNATGSLDIMNIDDIGQTQE